MSITNDETRLARHDTVYAVAYEHATRTRPSLTEGQRKALAAKVIELGAFRSFIDEPHCPTPDDNGIEQQISAYEILYPAMFKAAPDAQSVALALLAQRVHTPQEQLTLFRRVSAMTSDERLSASEGLDLKPTAAKPEAVDNRTPEQRAKNYTAEDCILAARGYDVDALMPSKRQELRAAVASENATGATSNIDAVRAKIALGATFSAIAPSVRVAAHREAAAAGKTLPDYGIDTAA